MLDISLEDREHLKKVLEHFKKPKNPEQVFYHMCFCLCTPQTTFKNNKIVLQRLVENHFYTSDITQEALSKMVKEVRFNNNKAMWLIGAKKNFNEILKIVTSEDLNSFDKRKWLVKNIVGFGMKTSSHFLRNLGCTDLAIIDTHIMKFLRLAHYPNGNNEAYQEIERIFIKKAEEHGLTPVEFDAYIWKISSNTSWTEFDR